MNSLITIMRDAHLLVDTCIHVRPAEKVVVVTDADNRPYGDAVAAAASQAGGSVILVDATQLVTAVLDTGVVQTPDHLAAAVQQANVTIIVTDQEFSQRFSHRLSEFAPVSPTRSHFQVDAGMGSWNLTPADLQLMQIRGEAIRDAVNNSKRIHITSPNGTDVTTSVGDRACLLVVPLPERGSVNAASSIPLWSEANWAPIDDATNGTVVVDGIMMGTGTAVRTVSAPIRWRVEAGVVVSIEGGEEAERLKETVGPHGRNARVIGELGIGASEKANLGTMEEKARLGTIHFAVGDSTAYPGGTNKSPIHLDGTVRNATIDVDGRVIVEKWQLRIDQRAPMRQRSE